MSQREKPHPLNCFLQEEMALSISRSLAEALEQLPSVTRLRLLAFLHFVEEPSLLAAKLDFSGSGDLRLTLVARQASGAGKRH